MEQMISYIKPELLVVAVVLYFVGKGLKKFQILRDSWILLIQGVFGIFLCTVWVLASCPLGSGREIAMAVFTAMVQGILVTGVSRSLKQGIEKISKKE